MSRKTKPALAVCFGVGLALLTGEIFFSVWENGREAETRALNKIPEGEPWLLSGSLFTPPSERNAYRGPVGNPRDFLEENGELGYRLKANLRALPGKMMRGGELLYDVTYSTSRSGWRVVPEIAGARTAVAFFGDSYIFGHGLSDEQTLPARYSSYSSAVQALNFGVPGWGAQHALRLIELGLEKQSLFGARLTKAYFVLIKEHLPRLAGLRIESSGSPKYAFPDGKPVFEGHFARGGGALSAACSWSALCEAGRSYFRISAMDSYKLPPGASHELVSVLKRAGELLQERHGSSFTVISWNVGDPEMDQLEAELKAAGLKVIGAKDALPGFPSADYTVPFDGHPNKNAADTLAKYLAAQ